MPIVSHPNLGSSCNFGKPPAIFLPLVRRFLTINVEEGSSTIEIPRCCNMKPFIFAYNPCWVEFDILPISIISGFKIETEVFRINVSVISPFGDKKVYRTETWASKIR